MKKIIVILLAVLMICSLTMVGCNNGNAGNPGNPVNPGGVAETDPSASKGLTYELNGRRDGYVVTGMGSCTDTRVVIPSVYNGLPVRSIADGAFQAQKPPVVEKPSEDGGKDKEKEKEKKSAFADPIFEIIPLSGTVELSDTGSVGIEEKAEAKIEEIVIPDSVMDIGDAAFYGCEELATFEVSNLIALIGTDAFKNTAYYLDEANWADGSLYLEEYLIEVRTDVSGEYTVREGTVNIASNAFDGCTGITAVSFPDSLRFLGNNAFVGCTAIAEVDLTIPGIQIGDSAFKGCTALTSVKIATDDVPNAPPVTSMEGFGNASVDAVGMPGGTIDIAFDPTADPDLIYSAMIGSYAFEGCTSLASVELGSNVGVILSASFKDCTALTSIDMSRIKAHGPQDVIVTPSRNHRFPMSLQNIFSGCTSLTDVKLPQGIEWLQGTFEGCTALKEFTVPDSVKGLNRTFIGCTGLESITIPESVTALAYTFESCTSLTEVTLPETLLKIGDRTFMGCDSLAGLYVPDSVEEIGERVFPYGEFSDFALSIGRGVKRIGREALYNNYAVIYRGTSEEWRQIELHENWNGGEGFEGKDGTFCIDIICADGTIVGNEELEESMSGILLADGTVYGRFFGVTIKFRDGREEIIEKDLAGVEADLRAEGAEGWRHVGPEDILKMGNSKYSIYAVVRDMARHHLEDGKPEQGGDSNPGGTTPGYRAMEGIKLSDGTLYATYKGITVKVTGDTVEESEISYKKLLSSLDKDGVKDWKSLSDKKILEQYGNEIYEEILTLVDKLSEK